MPSSKWLSVKNHWRRCDLVSAGPVLIRRQAAHKTLSSCSVMHSRQKNRPHSGQRATASRARWLWQRWLVMSGIALIIAESIFFWVIISFEFSICFVFQASNFLFSLFQYFWKQPVDMRLRPSRQQVSLSFDQIGAGSTIPESRGTRHRR